MDSRDLRPMDPETRLRNWIDQTAEMVARGGDEIARRMMQSPNAAEYHFLFPGDPWHEFYKQSLSFHTQKQAQNNTSSIRPPFFHEAHQPPPNSWNPQRFPLPPMPPLPAQGMFPSQNLPLPPPPFQPPIPPPNSREIQDRIKQLREQIEDSERNLVLHRKCIFEESLPEKIQECLEKCREDEIKNSCEELGINLKDFDQKLDHLSAYCNQERLNEVSIWVLRHSSSQSKSKMFGSHILHRILLQSTPSNVKVRFCYLLDLLVRNDGFFPPECMEEVIIPAFCFTLISAEGPKKEKLHKILEYWKSKRILDRSQIESMQNPEVCFDSFKKKEETRYSKEIEKIRSEHEDRFKKFEGQHNEFVCFNENEIEKLQKQLTPQLVPHLPPPPTAFPPPFPPQLPFPLLRPAGDPSAFPPVLRPDFRPPPVVENKPSIPNYPPVGVMTMKISFDDFDYKPLDTSIPENLPIGQTPKVAEAIAEFFASLPKADPNDWSALAEFESKKENARRTYYELYPEKKRQSEQSHEKSTQPVPVKSFKAFAE